MRERPLIGLAIGPESDGSGYLQLRSTYPHAIEQAGGVPVVVAPLAGAALHRRRTAGRFPGKAKRRTRSRETRRSRSSCGHPDPGCPCG